MRDLLDGLRVIDACDGRGALAGRLLADLGATVVKVQCNALDRHDDTDARHRVRDANKAVERLDLADAAGRSRLGDLLARADVYIDNTDPATTGSGLPNPDDIAGDHGHLVHLALRDLGLEGPRAGWHLEPLAAMASSGAHFASGLPELPPCSGPGMLAHDSASIVGALGVVAAIMDRRRTGSGQRVEISVQEAALSGLIPWSIPIADYLHISDRLPVAGTRNAEGTYHVFPCADGHVRTILGTEKHWVGFRELCGNPDEMMGDEWLSASFRRANADVVKLLLGETLADRTRADLSDQADETGATLGTVNLPLEYMAHPQTRHRGFFAEVDGDAIAAAPYTVEGERPTVALPDPTPVDWSAPAPWAAPADHATNPDGLLLDGVRIVEFGMAAVVPECNWMLSELGADVIKIESATRPDVLRGTGGQNLAAGYAYNVECRGRRNVALDLSTERGREIAADLCASADIVTENYRGGMLDRLGLGQADIRKRNPSVIHVSSQGYGRGGPMGTMAAWGPLNSCFGATHYLWNHPDAPYPCGTSLNHPDHVAGKMLATLVLAALDRRARTGAGADLELAQVEAGSFLLADIFLEAHRAGADPAPLGNASPHAAPHDVYAAAGDDTWVAIVCPTTASFEALAATIGLTVQPAWLDLEGRKAATDIIDSAINAWTSTRSAAEVADMLQAAGVSAMPVMGPADHRSDPHLEARNYLVTLDNPHVGPERQVGNPIRPSRLPLRTAQYAPAIGENTEDVLVNVLGMEPGAVDALIEQGVCR